MLIYNEHAPLAGRGVLECSLPNYTKSYPAYGLKLNELRRSGQIPEVRIIVTFDWKVGKIYPRIVISKDARIDLLIFDYLAGLSVQIVYSDGEDELVAQVVQAILKVNPKTLLTFDLDAHKKRC